MIYLIGTKEELQSIVDKIDIAKNYPNEITKTYAIPVKHPKNNKYMISVDDGYKNLFDESDLKKFGINQLDSSWFLNDLKI